MTSENIPQHNSIDESDFYDVASRFVSESAESSEPQALLKSWVRQYPAFAIELTEIAYAQFIADGDWTGTTEESVDIAVIESARKVLSRKNPKLGPITSLTAAAREIGLTPNVLARQVRIDLSILAKLEQRLVMTATIPVRLIETLSQSLGRSTADIVEYLTQPPRLAASAQYKSSQRPAITGTSQESFSALIRSSSNMSDLDREFWIEEMAGDENI